MSELLCVGFSVMRILHISTKTKSAQAKIREIAEIKLPDLNANDIDAAMRIVAGTARSMGVRFEGVEMKKTYVPSKKLAAILRGEA